jgi:hypothetical protein
MAASAALATPEKDSDAPRTQPLFSVFPDLGAGFPHRSLETAFVPRREDA